MVQDEKKPVLSIIMSFYNGPLLWIRLAISSILNQSFRDFEFIIICDKPDNKEAIDYIRALAEDDSRIKLYINSIHIGLTKSLNRALKKASGKFIARMDADDIAYPERLATQVRFLEADPSRLFCSSDVDVINENGKIKKRQRNKRKNTLEWIYMENYISHPSVMFRRELLDLREPFYNEFYRYTQDYELWIFLISQNIELHFIRESLIQYRDSKQNISAVHRKMQNRYFQQLHRNLILSRLEEFGISTEDKDLQYLLEQASQKCLNSEGQEAKDLYKILYVLYFTLAVEDNSYIMKYLRDPNRLFRHNRIQLFYKMLRVPFSGHRKNAYLDFKEAESL